LYLKYFSGKTSYSIESDENAIKLELMKNGPVEVAFTVYDDFLQYKEGSTYTFNKVKL
jgi:cathepsin B